MADTVSPSGDERPDPAAAGTPAEFVDAMLRLKRWTGWGFRRLENRAAAAGLALPRSTLTAALTRRTLPREDLVAAFTVACGCDEAETARWIAARRRIASTPAAPDLEPATEPRVAPAAAAPPSRLSDPSRRARRLVALAAVVTLVAAAAIGYLVLRPDDPSAPPRGPDQAAPARVDPSHSPPTPQPSTPTTEAVPAAPQAPPAPPTALTSEAEALLRPTAAQTPAARPPASSPPSSTTTGPVPTPPIQEPPDREVIQLPGEPTIYCPRPYLATMYAAVAQCTQLSGDQARPGYYSPITRQFRPTTDWMTVADQKWYVRDVLATDGVLAPARGYTVLSTIYGGGVFATQYRDGQARWGIINVIDGRFRPAAQGWQPIGP